MRHKLQTGEVHTLETIKARMIEEGDCWIWQAAVSHNSPALRHDGRVMYVRRFIAQYLQGKDTEGKYVTHNCGNPMCVNPAHVIVCTRQKLQLLAAQNTRYGESPLRSQRIARAKQAVSSLTWDDVRRIRAMEGTSRAIARELGMNFSRVHKIRMHQSWRETNPFTGL